MRVDCDMLFRRLAAVAFAAAATLAACSDGAIVPRSCTFTLPAAGLTVPAGARGTAPVTATCSATASPVLRWTSVTPSIATVDSVTGEVTGVQPGSTFVTASVVGVPGATAAIAVVVTATLDGGCRIAVSPASFTVAVGQTIKLTADIAGECGSPSPRASWSVNDTTVATVDSTGVVTGRRNGARVIVSVASSANPSFRAFSTGNVVENGFGITLQVSRASLTLSSLDTARLTANVIPSPALPSSTPTGATFATSDSCVARVSTDGLVLGIAPGTAALTVAARANPSVVQRVAVVVPQSRGPAVRALDLTTGSPATPADPTTLRGAATWTLAVERWLYTDAGRVDFWLGGRLVSTTSFGRAAPGETRTFLPLVVNTAAIDSATGVRLYANGPQTLEARIFGDGMSPFPGCAGLAVGQTAVLTQSVTLANP